MLSVMFSEPRVVAMSCLYARMPIIYLSRFDDAELPELRHDINQRDDSTPAGALFFGIVVSM